MKTITKQKARQGFDTIADLAHAGETVLVTHGGKPWVKLIPASKGKPGKSAAAFRT
jgi:antitoxin (DNA-binding transcriptional repressor) of toxin-antitoxin stability system